MVERCPLLQAPAEVAVAALAVALLLTLSACGGGDSGGKGSGSGGGTAPAPTVTLTATPTALTGSGTATLNWSSTNATSCSASNGWSGAQATVGSASSATLSATTTFSLSCSGAGGSSAAAATVTVTAAPGNVSVSGQITFDSVPFSATTANGLDYSHTTQAPARGVIVEAIAAVGGAALASTISDSNGQYALNVPANTSLFVRARAQMQRSGTPGWDFSVRDNTASDALYVLDGSSFNTGTTASVRNLNAASGWGITSYTGTRASAPFAILDTVYRAYNLVLSANSSAVFPMLQLEWSKSNVPAGQPTTAELAMGQISTTFFTGPATPNPARIYILGAADNDSDEFDAAVIAHEWGHYYQYAFSRDDSIGGNHHLSDKLDPRVAFSEGWGNAFSGMVRNDPLYRDSFGTAQHQDFSINVESSSGSNPGWYNEESIQGIIWDAFDNIDDAADRVSLGFAPIHAAMAGGARSTSAFTTIYPFMRALINANSPQAAALGQLLSAQSIVNPTDDFGSGETNSGGDARSLPVYALLTAGTPLTNVCSTTTAGTINHLGNRKFLRFDVAGTRTATITATGPATPTASDPDLVLYAAGVERARAETATAARETLTATSLSAGTYVVELYEFSNISGGTPRGDTCFTVQLTLN